MHRYKVPLTTMILRNHCLLPMPKPFPVLFPVPNTYRSNDTGSSSSFKKRFKNRFVLLNLVMQNDEQDAVSKQHRRYNRTTQKMNNYYCNYFVTTKISTILTRKSLDPFVVSRPIRTMSSSSSSSSSSSDHMNENIRNKNDEKLVYFHVNNYDDIENENENENNRDSEKDNQGSRNIDVMKSYLTNNNNHHSKAYGNNNSSNNNNNKIRGTIGTIVLNSPKTYNALTIEMGIEFQTICRQIRSDLMTSSTTHHDTTGTSNTSTGSIGARNVQAIVITGSTKNAFSAGGNLQWLQSLHDNTIQANIDTMQTFYSYFHELRTIPVPIIAAMNGPAMGAGACLALLCDLRTGCISSTKLGMHFTRLGIHSGMGGSYLLQQALGTGGASSAIVNEILLLGKVLNCNDCYKYNILNRIHESDALVPAYELAMEIVTKTHPVAVRLMLQTLRNNTGGGCTTGSSLQTTLQLESYLQAICYNQKDWGEGLSAISERRDPIFDPYHHHPFPPPSHPTST